MSAKVDTNLELLYTKAPLTNYEIALAAFRRGAYKEAREILAQPASRDDARLLVDIAARQRRWNDIVAASAFLQRFSDDDRRLATLFRIYAERAMSSHVSCTPPVEHATDALIEADVMRMHALLRWMDGDHDEAVALLRNARPKTPTQRVQQLELRAWATHSLSQRAAILSNALTIALEHNVDVGLIGIIAHPLAVLARETDLGEIGPRVCDLLRAINWQELRNDDRFYCERALAWLAAQDGNYIDAIYRLDRLPMATSSLQAAVAATDRARICKLATDAVNEAVAARHAFDAFEDINWLSIQNDAPVSFYGSVDVLFAHDAQRTTRLLERVEQSPFTSALGAQQHPAVRGFRALARAIVAANEHTALVHAREAHRTFHEIGYEFRSALAALRAYDCSRMSHWLDKVHDFVERHDRSPLFQELLLRRGPMRHVTARRQTILERVAASQTNREIAEALSLSENTVKEHIRVLHRIFQVSKRSELAREWLRLGGRSAA